MKILVTGFTGKVGFWVANNLKYRNIPTVCAVRNVEQAMAKYGSGYEFVRLDFSDISTFDEALERVDRIF